MFKYIIGPSLMDGGSRHTAAGGISKGRICLWSTALVKRVLGKTITRNIGLQLFWLSFTLFTKQKQQYSGFSFSPLHHWEIKMFWDWTVVLCRIRYLKTSSWALENCDWHFTDKLQNKRLISGLNDHEDTHLGKMSLVSLSILPIIPVCNNFAFFYLGHLDIWNC